MLRVCRTVAPVVVLFCLLATGAWAQGSRASISGIIQDPTGAAIPNVVFSLRSLATSAVAKTTSGSDGLYSFPNLTPGVYELTVSAKGFREYLQKGISVNLDQQVRIDVPLEVG